MGAIENFLEKRGYKHIIELSPPKFKLYGKGNVRVKIQNGIGTDLYVVGNLI